MNFSKGTFTKVYLSMWNDDGVCLKFGLNLGLLNFSTSFGYCITSGIQEKKQTKTKQNNKKKQL